ncbi:MAG: 7-cyano-7-deazaguanine synthase QueC [Alphaproteobacteria bacterium]|nr:7-cyano-7-deazaguanine synthase QueC [Alphaproteobacteria bacterium]
MKTLIICSGGLDSVTLAHKVAEDKDRTLTRLVSFDYGQRHKKELSYAKACADRLGVPHHIVDISSVGKALTGSALTDDVDVPDGHYAEESMKITIVPNRNAIMLAIAYGMACSNGDEAVATAVHGGDHFIYPDCRPDFLKSFATMQGYALEDVAEIELYTPYASLSKTEIAADAGALNLPLEETWSCYKGGEIHCGTCGTCVERREAFDLAGVKDTTEYADENFWRESVKKAESA